MHSIHPSRPFHNFSDLTIRQLTFKHNIKFVDPQIFEALKLWKGRLGSVHCTSTMKLKRLHKKELPSRPFDLSFRDLDAPSFKTVGPMAAKKWEREKRKHLRLLFSCYKH